MGHGVKYLMKWSARSLMYMKCDQLQELPLNGSLYPLTFSVSMEHDTHKAPATVRVQLAADPERERYNCLPLFIGQLQPM